MPHSPRGTWSLVLLPALLSLVVTIVRLVGEWNGWGGALFHNAGPDPKQQQGLFGITLLIPVFGFWFGWRLRADTGGPAHAGKAALLYLLGPALLAGGFWAALGLGWITLPTEGQPGVPTGLPWAAGILGTAILAMFAAWPRLSATLLLYALLARLPVVVITFVAVAKQWGTHYEKLPPNFVLPPDADKALFLSMPQLTFWPFATVFVGGLCGCLAAALARKKG